MWNQQDEEAVSFDDTSDVVALPSDERVGYVDQDGVPNPMYVDSADEYDHYPTKGFGEERSQRILELWVDFIADLSFLFGTLMYLWLILSQSKEVFMSLKNGDEYDEAIHTGFGWLLHDVVVTPSFSHFMVYGVIAATFMLATGSFRLYTSRSWSDRVPHIFMVFASIFLIVSSSLLLKHPFLSKVFFSLSIHVFALQGATTLCWRISKLNLSERYSNFSIYVQIFADVIFLTSTLGGIFLSYWYLFDASEFLAFPIKYVQIVSASLWCLSAVLYLFKTTGKLTARGIATWKARRNISGNADGKEENSLPQEDTQSTDEKTETKEDVVKAMQDQTPKGNSSDDIQRDLAMMESNDSVYNDTDDENIEQQQTYGDYTEYETTVGDRSAFTAGDETEYEGYTAGDQSAYSSAWTEGPENTDNENDGESALDDIFSARSASSEEGDSYC